MFVTRRECDGGEILGIIDADSSVGSCYYGDCAVLQTFLYEWLAEIHSWPDREIHICTDSVLYNMMNVFVSRTRY